MPSKSLPVLNDEVDTIDFKSLFSFALPVYLDNNATTQVDNDAMSVMLKAMAWSYANPSALHKGGSEARECVEKARADVAQFIGCKAEEVVFTSGATESINTAISSAVITQYPKKHFVSCHTEHGATLNKLKEVEEKVGYKVSYLDVDRQGKFDISQLRGLLEIDPGNNNLVSLMAVNNETGTIHDNIYEAIELAHKYGALFHIDAVQAAGKLPLRPYIEAGVDFLSVSGHKFYAPKGIGALFVKDGIDFVSSIVGGYQENNKRAGTENVPGIVALGAVCKKYLTGLPDMSVLHQRFIKSLLERLPSCIINGGGLAGTINVGFRYVSREAMVMRLSHNGVYASVGSSCAMGMEPSHTLKAMRVPADYVNGSVRFSMSKHTTEQEVDRAVEVIVKSYNELQDIARGVIG